MIDVLTGLIEWMEGLPPLLMYGTILLIAFGENVVPPIPGDMIVVFGGYLAGTATLNIWIVIALSTIGGTLGFMTMFILGNRLGGAISDPARLRRLPKDQIQVGKEWLQRWGFGLIAANRFLSGTRSIISLVAGMAHMHPGRVLLFSAISAAVWTCVIAWLGYFLGDNYELVGHYLAVYGKIIFWLVFAVAVAYAARRYVRRRAALSDTADDPVSTGSTHEEE